MDLPDWLTAQARRLADRPALITPDQIWTWRELYTVASETAGRLAALGVGARDRVALLLPTGADFGLLVHAGMRLGAVLVPLNTRLTPAELAWQLADAQPRLLIHAGHYDRAARAAVADLPNVQRVTTNPHGADDTPSLWLTHMAPLPRRDRLDLVATLAIIYTSGTTGRPKGAQLTVGNFWWSAVGSALNLGTRPDDRWLAVLPLFHVGGLSILLRSVIYGVPAVVHERFDPDAVNAAIDDEGVTHVSVVSAMLGRMLDARGDRPYPPTLRCLLLGGGPVPLPLLERCAAIGAPVVQTYGLTETTSQAVTLAPADALTHLGSAGQPLLPTELRIEREGQPVEAGDVGEIVVRGPTVTPGYWGRPDATAAAIRDGWLHTGDLGTLDDEGYLYVLDRRDDLIISGGENVYPAEVEAVLLAYPGVAEAGVIGAPDPQWGQVAVGVVVPQPGITLDPAALIAFCAARLARYKVPARIDLATEPLPRNAAGKLLRRELRGRGLI
jgi:O-succinylbenzoic acid--CoA ligase